MRLDSCPKIFKDLIATVRTKGISTATIIPDARLIVALCSLWLLPFLLSVAALLFLRSVDANPSRDDVALITPVASVSTLFFLFLVAYLPHRKTARQPHRKLITLISALVFAIILWLPYSSDVLLQTQSISKFSLPTGDNSSAIITEFRETIRNLFSINNLDLTPALVSVHLLLNDFVYPFIFQFITAGLLFSRLAARINILGAMFTTAIVAALIHQDGILVKSISEFWRDGTEMFFLEFGFLVPAVITRWWGTAAISHVTFNLLFSIPKVYALILGIEHNWI